MELFRLLGTIAVNNTEANDAIDDTTNRASDSEKKTSSALAKVGGVAGKIATGIGLAGAAIGGAFLAITESTREYRKEMGLLESAYATAGHSTEVAKKTYSDLNAVMGDSGAAVEAAQHLSLVADNEQELSEMTHSLTGVYATFGSSLPLEGLAEAINHSSSLGSTQGSLADALEWSGITVEEFDAQLAECSNEEERQDLIMKTLKDTYSQAADQYKKTNKDVMDAEKANEALADAFSELGAIAEPILTKIKEKVAEFVSVAAPKLQEFIDKVKDATQWVKDNEQTIKIWVGIIIGATAAVGTFLLIMNWGTIMAAASKAIAGVRLAVLAFNAALMANPVGIVVGLIVGLVATFIYLWNNVDGFKEFWIKAWKLIQDKCSDAWKWIEKTWSKAGEWFKSRFDAIKKAGKEVMDNIRKFFSDAYKAVQNAWSNCTRFFSGIYSGIKNTFSSIGSWFGNIFRNAWTNIKNAFSNWGSFFSGLWGNIKSKFASIGTSLGTSMGNAVKNGMNKIIGSIESTINKGIGLINSAIRLANKLPGINVGTVPTLKLPKLSEGGILKRGQVGLLEGSGAEAVVPLERNTEWIDRISERLNSRNDNTVLQNRLNVIIDLLEQFLGMKIYLDSGVLVGELSPAIDQQLGRISDRKKRGNT